MKTLNALTELLIEERKKQGLSQKDMYMLIGMSQQQYQKIESGQDIKVSTLLRILAGLGLELSITDINSIKGDEEPQSSSSDNIWSNQHKHLED